MFSSLFTQKPNALFLFAPPRTRRLRDPPRFCFDPDWFGAGGGARVFAEISLAMVQLPDTPRKRRANQAAAAAHVPPPGDVKVEADGFCDGNVPVLKRVKAVQMSPPPLQQDMYCDVLEKPSPLGLQLKKSASFVDLLQKVLSQTKSSAGQSAMDNSISEPPVKKEIKSVALTAGERLKASNFPANFLKIGTWEYTSQYEGDLVAKCYYAKHKLVWEVLDAGLKSKIEIQWSHITSLKVTCPEDGDGTLDLVLSRPPLFFKETDPQPRKHTLWQAASDFTGGQASLHRRHILQCPSSLLSKNFEKLIQCDQRLDQLSQQPDIILDSPVFESRSTIFENPNDNDASLPKFTHPASRCAVSSMSKTDGMKDFILKQPALCAQPVNLDVQADVIAQEQKNPNMLNQLTVRGLRSSMSMDDLVNHLGNCIAEERTAGNEAPSREFLEIAQSLLSDTQGPPSSDEKYLMARVDSLYSLLEKDIAPTNLPMPEHNNGDSILVGEVGSVDFDEELKFSFENEELGSAPANKTADDGTEPPAISRKDSFGELLQTLPHIASVPQFLFDIEEDSENSGSHT